MTPPPHYTWRKVGARVALAGVLCALVWWLAGTPSDPPPNRPDPRRLQLVPNTAPAPTTATRGR